jgi:hypothetical protein
VNTDYPFVLATVGAWVAPRLELVMRDRRRGSGTAFD